MANLRYLKKEIDYRLEEVVFDCDMAICFQPSKETEIFEVMQEAVAIRNVSATTFSPRRTIPPSRITLRLSASTMLRCVPRWSMSSKNSSRSSARSTRRKSKACSFRIRAVLHGGTAFFAFIQHRKFSRQLSRLFPRAVLPALFPACFLGDPLDGLLRNFPAVLWAVFPAIFPGQSSRHSFPPVFLAILLTVS